MTLGIRAETASGLPATNRRTCPRCRLGNFKLPGPNHPHHKAPEKRIPKKQIWPSAQRINPAGCSGSVERWPSPELTHSRFISDCCSNLANVHDLLSPPF